MENDNRKILCGMSLPHGQRLICSISSYRGKKGLDIRLHYFDPETKEWCPTQKGIRVPIEKARDFQKLIIEAFAQLDTSSNETTQSSSNDGQFTLLHIGGNSKQPSANHSDLLEDDSENEKSEPPENDTDDDPEKRMNEWLGRQ